MALKPGIERALCLALISSSTMVRSNRDGLNLKASVLQDQCDASSVQFLVMTPLNVKLLFKQQQNSMTSCCSKAISPFSQMMELLMQESQILFHMAECHCLPYLPIFTSRLMYVTYFANAHVYLSLFWASEIIPLYNVHCTGWPKKKFTLGWLYVW